MDQAWDLSQPDYKRFRLGLVAQNIVGRSNKRNNSFDPINKGTFIPLKHPYEWDTQDKKPVPYSFIKESKAPSNKVTNSSFDQKEYNENAKNNNPIAKGNEIALRLNYINKEDVNKSTFMNTKYLKNYSTLGTEENDGFSQSKSLALLDPRSVVEIMSKNPNKKEVSAKVGNNVIVSTFIILLISNFLAYRKDQRSRFLL